MWWAQRDAVWTAAYTVGRFMMRAYYFRKDVGSGRILRRRYHLRDTNAALVIQGQWRRLRWWRLLQRRRQRINDNIQVMRPSARFVCLLYLSADGHVGHLRTAACHSHLSPRSAACQTGRRSAEVLAALHLPRDSRLCRVLTGPSALCSGCYSAILVSATLLAPLAAVGALDQGKTHCQTGAMSCHVRSSHK